MRKIPHLILEGDLVTTSAKPLTKRIGKIPKFIPGRASVNMKTSGRRDVVFFAILARVGS